MTTSLAQAFVDGELVRLRPGDEASVLFGTSCFGSKDEQGMFVSIYEALYLLQKEKLEILDDNGKAMGEEAFCQHAKSLDSRFWTKFVVYSQMRTRGYIVKTAVKFGADFRVYDRGVRPGEDHAKWIVYAVKAEDAQTWHDFAAKNRVAHSTKKRLLIGIVDDENDVIFYEVKWTRP